MIDFPKLLDIMHRAVFFFVGFSLGAYITRTDKSNWQVFILQMLVYTVLVVLYFVAKAIVE